MWLHFLDRLIYIIYSIHVCGKINTKKLYVFINSFCINIDVFSHAECKRAISAKNLEIELWHNINWLKIALLYNRAISDIIKDTVAIKMCPYAVENVEHTF